MAKEKLLKIGRYKLTPKAIIFAVVVLLIEFVIFSYLSYPPNLLYITRNIGQDLYANTKSTPQAKANVYLEESVRLQKYLEEKLKNNSKDPTLGLISQELSRKEQKAIKLMDEAKKQNVDISAQVTKLCDTILKHYSLVSKALETPHADAQQGLLDSRDALQKHISESMAW